jgi:hypothetical protein
MATPMLLAPLRNIVNHKSGANPSWPLAQVGSRAAAFVGFLVRMGMMDHISTSRRREGMMLTPSRCAIGLTAMLVPLLAALPAASAPSKLECAMTLAAARNALATLGRLEKSLDAARA